MPPTVGVAFVRPFVCSSVCSSVAYIANNSRTQRPGVPEFGRKVPHLRCDSHTSFKVKQSLVRVRGGWGHTVSAEPGGHTACFVLSLTITQTKPQPQQMNIVIKPPPQNWKLYPMAISVYLFVCSFVYGLKRVLVGHWSDWPSRAVCWRP